MAPRITLALLALALGIAFGPSGADVAVTLPQHQSTWVGVRLVGLEGDPVRSVEAQNVIERFAETGLELPTVTVEFHASTTPCNGHDGFIRYVEPAPVIAICSERPYVLPHELAHAWVDANLTGVDKSDYVERWGLASWDGADDEWNERGTEHAAFVIQQNLGANPPRMTDTWLERAEAFEMLTGLDSPLTLASSSA